MVRALRKGRAVERPVRSSVGVVMIRVFPRRTAWTPTDDMAFIGEPPLFRPDDASIPVRVSVTFTWDMDEAERIAGHWEKYYSDVQVGGPAYDSPAGEFVSGRFMKEGCTITTRGCPKRCKWCVVPQREGAMIELGIRDGWIIQDNNLFAASEKHIWAVFDMLRRQDRNVFFTGGIDKHFLKPWHVELLRNLGKCEVLMIPRLKQPSLHIQKEVVEGLRRDVTNSDG